jgi:hypothetical protein
VAVPAAAQEPSLHDVYQAAEAGNFSQAQRMMDTVLSAHPNSAKAHYVEAELLAKQGRLAPAGAELATAERLDPGLSFAKPEAVRELRAQLASRGGAGGSGVSTVAPGNRVSAAMTSAPVMAQAGPPWGVILGGLLLVGLVVFVVRAMARRNAAATLMPGPGATRYGGAPAFGGAGPVSPQPYGYGGAPGPMPAAGGGLGSGILGGLATGAAVGAGLVAGEALAHRFTEGHQPDGAGILPIPGNQQYDVPNDMGGNDFGVSDGGSWDDNSFGGVDGGGGGDWT